MSLSQPPSLCDSCGQPYGSGKACRSCYAVTLPDGQSVYLATRWRRLGGSLLDGLFFVVTLGVGWGIWLHFTARTAQTPAKRLLFMYIVMSKDHAPATYRRVWLREAGVEWILFGIILSWASGGIVPLIDALWILFDRNKQTLHDKLAETLVVHAPTGLTAIEAGRGATIGRQPRPGQPRPGPTPSPGGPESFGSSDTRERLRKLRSLWEIGEISADEYQERRRRILDEI